MMPRASPGETPTPLNRISGLGSSVLIRWESNSDVKRRRRSFWPHGLSVGRGFHPRSIFAEFARDQRFDFLDRLLRIGAFAADEKLRSLPGRQHHQTHDAFAVNFL